VSNETEKQREVMVNIQKVADKNGYVLTKNASKIAKAKSMFFASEEWWRCPCYPREDTEHGCDKPLCNEEISRCGVCHCNLYELSMDE
jgi:ferredoxin-thioredoxin reductase catalytic subunit